MSSETSTSSSSTFQPWQFYLLLGMAAATVAVWRAVDTHPAALLLLSGAVISAALVAIGVHYTVLAFMGEVRVESGAVDVRTRAILEQEKAAVLRSIKELEFDRAMGKISQADFDALNARLRARAMSLIEQIDRATADSAPDGAAVVPPARPATDRMRCGACGAENEADARFCKACGTKVER
ncbi:MAG: zinc ribbon domain-containing protein [Acidobacteriota bacterium]|jgi:hypothetical protein